MTHRKSRRGFNVVELIVVVVILGLLILVLMMSLPRRLEGSRNAACQKNLMHIGVALAIYDHQKGRLPAVPELGTGSGRGGGPLRVLLEALALPDLREAEDPSNPPPGHPGNVVTERPVPGFVCASDRNATAGRFPAPISYRACTGDTPGGIDGAFGPGRKTSLAEIEAADGTGYTAGFAERLVGDGRDVPGVGNYASLPGSLPASGCAGAPGLAWHGDAGASWYGADWRSTLYNHALRPNAAPSCIAGDGKAAAMGASSAHPGGVNVLMLDGAVKTYRATIDPKIWRALAAPQRQPSSEAAASGR